MANQKLTALGALAAPTRDDLLYVVDDPGGIPASYRATIENVISGPTLFVAASNALADAVRNADYVCDGTADDVQIQAAINALPATGGRVILSEGKFTIAATIVLASYISLVGQGEGTEIELVATSGITYMIQAASKTRITLADFFMDGTKATNNATGIFLDTCTYCRLRNISVSNAQVDGITLIDGSADCIVENCIVTDSGDSEACFDLKDSSRIQLARCQAINSGRAGFEIENGCADVTLVGCLAYNAATVGFDVHTHAAYGENYRITFIGCSAIDNTSHGFYPSGEGVTPQYDRQLSFLGCIAQGNGARQFLLTRQKQAAIRDCIAISGAGASSIIEVQSSCLDGIVIAGNYVERAVAGTYGIENVATANTIIEGNEVHNCTTHGGIYSAQPAQIIGNKLVGNIDGIQLAVSANRSSVVGNTVLNNTRYGIYLNGVSYCTIQGNRCFDDQGVKTQDSGIQEAGAADWNLIVGNLSRAADHQVAGIVTVGVNTVAVHNLT